VARRRVSEPGTLHRAGPHDGGAARRTPQPPAGLPGRQRRQCDEPVRHPTQFDRPKTLAKYPRDLEGTAAWAATQGGRDLRPDHGGGLPLGLCHLRGGGRPDRALGGRLASGHFRGVATVCTKLFTICRPHRAFFGQKDYQQTLVVKRLAADLNLDLEIIVLPTVREPDGLA